MFQVRSDHMSALSAQQAAGFAGRMVTHLREIFPAEVAVLDDARLRLLVERVRTQAEQWSIVEEPHVERLIELFVSFDALRRRPLPDWLAEIVEYPGRTGEEILLRLEEELFFEEHR